MLCNKCAQSAYTCDVGTCKNCGSWTSSGMFNLCDSCSQKLNQCQHCNASLKSGGGQGGQSGQGGNSKRKGKGSSKATVFIVAVDTDHYLEDGQAMPTGEEFKAHCAKSLATFKSELQVWLRKQRAVRKFEIVNEMTNLCVLVVRCPKELADKLQSFPGVANVARNSAR